TRPDTSVSRAAMRVFPTDISFGNLTVSNFPGTPQVKSFTIQNSGSAAGRVYVSGLNDDKNAEFEIQFPSCSPASGKMDSITVDKGCEGLIRFVPKAAGKKVVTVSLQSDVWEKPVIVNIFATVEQAPTQPARATPTPNAALERPTPTAAAAPAAPKGAPDL